MSSRRCDLLLDHRRQATGLWSRSSCTSMSLRMQLPRVIGSVSLEGSAPTGWGIGGVDSPHSTLSAQPKRHPIVVINGEITTNSPSPEVTTRRTQPHQPVADGRAS